jgi:hypothetical protein
VAVPSGVLGHALGDAPRGVGTPTRSVRQVRDNRSVRWRPSRFLYGYAGDVADAPRVISAEELDAMSPDERAQVVRDHIVTDLGQLPDGFRRRVETTAARLAEQIRPTTG